MYNIPRSVTDTYYRYKMPIMRIKIEGKGNGVRTVITNMKKIMLALDRPLEYGVKYMGMTLGVSTKIDAYCTLNGKHDDEKLASCLDQFIDVYVLCSKCKNPETILTIKKTTIHLNCKACGKISPINAVTKFSNYILKGYTPSSFIPVNVIKVADIEWSADTSPEAVAKRKCSLGIHSSHELKNTFINLFTDDVRCDFYRKIEHIRPLINNLKDMIILLRCFEKWTNEISHILNGLYESGIVTEESILKWHKHTSEDINTRSIPFIDWLTTEEID